MDSVAHILHHPVVDRIGTAWDGLHQSSPPSHRGERLQSDALLHHRPQDEFLTIGKLIKYLVKRLQILRRMGDIGLEELLLVLKNRDFCRSAARVDDQDLHIFSPRFAFYCSIQ